MAVRSTAAVLLLAILSVCASARTVPQQSSFWSHVMRAWTPVSPAQQHLKPPVSGYALYDEATGNFEFTHEAPANGELGTRAAQGYAANMLESNFCSIMAGF
jgi:hypothetical protein